jgi:hypothetical protein
MISDAVLLTVKLIWTSLMAIGLALDLWLSRDAFGDEQNRKREFPKDFLLKIGSERSVRNAVTRAVYWLSLMSMGFFALSISPDTPQTTTFPVNVSLLIISCLCHLFCAVMDRKNRRQVRRYGEGEATKRRRGDDWDL